jgi:tetratricopeptide (TPR) repeat protein
MYRLQFQSGRHAGRTLAVRQAVLTLGSGTGCHVSLPGEAMPEKAACLEENAAGVFFCGLAPGAATCNGEPVEGSRKLQDGDVLGVAGTRLVFLLRERREKKRSTRVSWGLMQPAAALASLALVVGEMALMGYLSVWPLLLILPETELADRKAAKVLREELAQEAAKEGKEKPGATAALSLPGVSVKDGKGGAGGAAGTAGGAGGEGGAAAVPESGEAAAAAAVLADADFAPAKAEADLSTLPPISAADPRIEEAQRKLARADMAAQFADYGTAERLLDEIHAETPGFLPAYREHARVLEAQGKWSAALQRWRQLKGLSPEGSPFRAQADEALARMRERAAALAAARAARGGGGGAASAGRSAGAAGGASGAGASAVAASGGWARVAEAEVTRMPESGEGDVAEMRVLRARIETKRWPGGTEERRLEAWVEFFDRTADGKVVASGALTPGNPVEVVVRNDGKGGTVEGFTYVKTKAMRAREKGEREFYGYRIRLSEGGKLLDQAAKPRKLLEAAGGGTK